jgi:tetratricopeptide (TPR) repeat protein
VRIEPLERDKELVLDRYARACAICGGQDAVDAAHLYEDATRRRASSSELIVLCSTHNQAQARSHGKSTPALPGTFNPYVLQAQGRLEFRRPNSPLAYAKARLAAYIFETNAAYSEALDCLTEALSAIRPLRWGDWLAATMKEAERLCVKYSSDIGSALRWLFLDRMALVLYDYSRWDESIDVLLESISLSAGLSGDPYNPRRRDADQANSFRRQSLIKASTARLDTGQSIPKLLDSLEDTAKGFLRLGQYDAFATTLDVARKIALEVTGDFEKAHRYSEQALSQENRISHNWVLQEHIASEAGYFFSKKDFLKARECMYRTMRLYSKHPVVLEPILTNNGPRPHDIHEDLKRMGITYESLLSNQVTIVPPISEVPLALTKSAVRRIVRSIAGR